MAEESGPEVLKSVFDEKLEQEGSELSEGDHLDDFRQMEPRSMNPSLEEGHIMKRAKLLVKDKSLEKLRNRRY